MPDRNPLEDTQQFIPVFRSGLTPDSHLAVPIGYDKIDYGLGKTIGAVMDMQEQLKTVIGVTNDHNGVINSLPCVEAADGKKPRCIGKLVKHGFWKIIDCAYKIVILVSATGILCGGLIWLIRTLGQHIGGTP